MVAARGDGLRGLGPNGPQGSGPRPPRPYGREGGAFFLYNVPVEPEPFSPGPSRGPPEGLGPSQPPLAVLFVLVYGAPTA